MTNDRREFMKAALALAATCATGGLALGAEKKAGRKGGKKGGGKGKKGGKKAAGKPPIGLQLYVVRNQFAADVPGTLKKVAAMGYQGVEFYGYNGTPQVFTDKAKKEWSAKELRALLDENKLKCCGIHLSVKSLEPECLATTVENMKVLGNRFLNVSSAGPQMKTAETIAAFAKFMNETAAKVKPEGMVVGYHAHGPDWVKIGDAYAWDLLFTQLDKSINMQVDIGNSLQGGGDPLGALKKYPGRTRTIHLKSYQDKTFESDYFKEVFQVCDTQQPVRWWIVEEGEAGDADPFAVAAQALATLHKLGK